MHFQTTFRPARRAFRRLLGVLVVRRIRDAFIKRHRDIRPEIHLRARRHFRRQKLLGSVDMGTEIHAFLFDLAHRAQAEYLEPAAVGEHRARPLHKLMQAPGRFNQFRTGTQK